MAYTQIFSGGGTLIPGSNPSRYYYPAKNAVTVHAPASSDGWDSALGLLIEWEARGVLSNWAAGFSSTVAIYALPSAISTAVSGIRIGASTARNEDGEPEGVNVSLRAILSDSRALDKDPVIPQATYKFLTSEARPYYVTCDADGIKFRTGSNNGAVFGAISASEIDAVVTGFMTTTFDGEPIVSSFTLTASYPAVFRGAKDIWVGESVAPYQNFWTNIVGAREAP